MPYKRKDSAVYWVSFTDPSGARIRRSTGTTDRKEAEALEAKWKYEAFLQQQWDEAPARVFDEVMLYYLKQKEQLRSYRDLKLLTMQLRKSFKGCMMNTLGARHISEYITMRKGHGLANASVNRELEVLSAAINLVNRDLEWNLPNPVTGRKLREPEGKVRWLQVDEADRLLDAAGRSSSAPHLVDFITVALHTGMRKSEILGMQWDRVDLSASLMHLEAIHTKSRRRRSIPVNRTAREALYRRMRFRREHCRHPGCSAIVRVSVFRTLRRALIRRAAGRESWIFESTNFAIRALHGW
jgi:integrase